MSPLLDRVYLIHYALQLARITQRFYAASPRK